MYLNNQLVACQIIPVCGNVKVISGCRKIIHYLHFTRIVGFKVGLFTLLTYIFYHLQIIVMSNLQDKLNDLLKGKSESEIQNIIEGLGKSESTEKSEWNEGRPKSPAVKKLLVDEKSDDDTELLNLSCPQIRRALANLKRPKRRANL